MRFLPENIVFATFFNVLAQIRYSPLDHQRNLFCLPRQKRFFLAFWAKSSEKQVDYGQNGLRSNFTAASEPVFFIQAPKAAENAGVLLGVLYGCKELLKVSGRQDLNHMRQNKPYGVLKNG